MTTYPTLLHIDDKTYNSIIDITGIETERAILKLQPALSTSELHYICSEGRLWPITAKISVNNQFESISIYGLFCAKDYTLLSVTFLELAA